MTEQINKLIEEEKAKLCDDIYELVLLINILNHKEDEDDINIVKSSIKLAAIGRKLNEYEK